MTMTRIPGVDYKINGDLIKIEQQPADENELWQLVTLHKMHIQHIAGELGAPTLSITAETIKRRLEIVTDRLCDLAASERYRSEIIQRIAEGMAFLTELDAICELASEFVADLNNTLDTQEAE